jgi:glucose/arabinose dehydrogenase
MRASRISRSISPVPGRPVPVNHGAPARPVAAAFLACFASLALHLPPAAAAAIPTGVDFRPVFESDSRNRFTWPVGLFEIPGSPGRFLVLEKNGGDGATGRIWKLQPGSGLPWIKTEFLSLPVASENASNNEIGLLGLAFHPRFAENGRYFVDFNPTTRIHAVEERRCDLATGKDAGEAKRLLTLPANDGHNGGTLAFGHDGMLYVSVGDATDPTNGQKRTVLNGKILRIDVDQADAGLPYAIPKDNPFLTEGMRGEIFAFGFRNPWRFSFDPATGALWAGDVGQGLYEEINKVEKGGNYGWNAFEGAVKSGTCATPVCAEPVLAYGRDLGRCVIGGHVYRGDPTSQFYGAYIFGDYLYNGPVFAIMADGAPGPLVQIGELGESIGSFATDSQGNIYVIGHGNGAIYKLEHAELRPGNVGIAAQRFGGRRGKDGRENRGADGAGSRPRAGVRYVKPDGSRAQPWETGAVRIRVRSGEGAQAAERGN